MGRSRRTRTTGKRAGDATPSCTLTPDHTVTIMAPQGGNTDHPHLVEAPMRMSPYRCQKIYYEPLATMQQQGIINYQIRGGYSGKGRRITEGFCDVMRSSRQ